MCDLLPQWHFPAFSYSLIPTISQFYQSLFGINSLTEPQQSSRKRIIKNQPPWVKTFLLLSTFSDLNFFSVTMTLVLRFSARGSILPANTLPRPGRMFNVSTRSHCVPLNSRQYRCSLLNYGILRIFGTSLVNLYSTFSLVNSSILCKETKTM